MPEKIFNSLNFHKYSKNARQMKLFEEKTQNLEEQVNGWDFAGFNTQYLTHSLHPYLAAMIPQISDKLIKMYMRSGERLLDPFVGGGAVAVEGYLNGAESYGFDINPLSIIISKAKTTKIAKSYLQKIEKSLRFEIEAYRGEEISFHSKQKIDYWFLPYMKRPLSAIIKSIKEIYKKEKDRSPELGEDLENFLKCIFSRSVRDVSLTYRGEVRLRRLQGKDLEKFNPDVLEIFFKRLSEGITSVSNLPDGVRPVIDFCDVRKISYEDNFFSTIITSPPYGDVKNTIPYHQFSKNMLFWLGMEDGQDIIKHNALGRVSSDKKIPPSPTLKAVINEMENKALIHEAACFYHDYLNALEEMCRVTKNRIIIVIGHRVLNHKLIENPTITTELMESLGWRLKDLFKRKIKKKRINKKMGFGHNAKGGTIDRESILVYSPS